MKSDVIMQNAETFNVIQTPSHRDKTFLQV